MVPINDPSVLVPVLAHETENLGFVLTSNIIQEHPFNIARRMSPLDHITGGCIGWNVVTPSMINAACRLTHDERRFIGKRRQKHRQWADWLPTDHHVNNRSFGVIGCHWSTASSVNLSAPLLVASITS
jgi:alkanesulfonate monooxygenase SsuD/methylene tetrahydromethanopterin reductase-like flavin-dependent oxidoreductase (luciferase family)